MNRIMQTTYYKCALHLKLSHTSPIDFSLFSKAKETRECETKSIPEYSSLKVSLYLMQAVIVISLADFNEQVENFQGQSLIIEAPQREAGRENGEKMRQKKTDEGLKPADMAVIWFCH